MKTLFQRVSDATMYRRDLVIRAVALSLALFMVLVSGCQEAGSPTTTSTTVPAPSTSIDTTVPTAPVSDGDPGHDLLLADVDPDLLAGSFELCGDCHSLLDRSALANPALVARFSHETHLRQGAVCETCHLVPTHTENGIARPPMSKCMACHSQTDQNAPPGSCPTCHPPGFSLEPSSHADPQWLPTREALVTTRATHPAASVASPEECATCHAPAFCSDCHGLDMPHPDGWQEVHQREAAEIGGQTCMQCHPDNESCQACHHKGYVPGGPSWRDIHPQTVYQDGPLSCFQCHSSITCAHCHTTGEYKDFSD